MAIHVLTTAFGELFQQYLTIPVYTIFKNLTIILIAYGEVLWFGSSVTSMTLVSFGLMVSMGAVVLELELIDRFSCRSCPRSLPLGKTLRGSSME